MDTLNVTNPFNAPVYYLESVSSTMDVSRQLLSAGKPHGTVITAGFQQNGRGRMDRQWEMEKEKGLAFTVLLKYPSVKTIPSALTLRCGLAVSIAIEKFAPVLQGSVMVKWPNDIMINNKKAAGILCEAVSTNVFVGIGVNVCQHDFPPVLQNKTTSIALAANTHTNPDQRFSLLEKILAELFIELETKNSNWKYRLEQRLYQKNQQVVFIEGAAGCGNTVKGTLVGVAEGGELLIIPDGESITRSFIAGELVLQSVT